MATALAIALWLVSLLPFVLVQHQLATALVQAVLMVGLVVIAWRKQRPERWELLAFSLAWAILYAVWLVSGQRLGLMCAQLVSAGMSIYVLFFARGARSPGRGKRQVPMVVAGVIIELCALLLMVPFFDADAFTSMIRNDEGADAAVAHEVQADGVDVTYDVSYGQDFPSSYLDVYHVADGAPTVVYVHGGDYCFGDKQFEKPAVLGAYGGTGSRDGYFAYLEAYLAAGYNVVSINYALTPEYRYPTPLIQLSEAMTYLGKNAQSLGLDMDDVTLIGSVTGANIVGAYALAQSDVSYALWLGLPNDFANGKIRAVVLNSGVLDNGGLSDTDNWVMDYIGDACVRSYFNTATMNGAEGLNQSNIITQTRTSFPPTYLSDGSVKSFADQAELFSRRLDALGVTNELHIYEGQGNGFMFSGSDAAAQDIASQIAFVDQFAK